MVVRECEEAAISIFEQKAFTGIAWIGVKSQSGLNDIFMPEMNGEIW